MVVFAIAVYLYMNKNNQEDPDITTEDLEAFNVKIYEEKVKIDLHDVVTLEDLPFNSGDVSGKYILLNFWTTWCPYCVLENPSLQRLHEKNIDEKFTVLTVSLDRSLDTVKEYLQENQYDFPVIVNTQSNLWDEYAPMIPATYLLSPDWYIIAEMDGNNGWDSEEALRVLDHLMSL